ncbi:MAG TPA: hypothetical protein VF462_01405 [Micromonosporaceae bacterium]
MSAADVHLSAQPRIDTVVTGFTAGSGRVAPTVLRTDYAGMAWIGDRPDDETGLTGPDYRRRSFDTRLFLPDTHWYNADLLADAEVQASGALLQVAATDRGSQGLVGAWAEPDVEFYEHPDGLGGVGLCLWLRGDIWSNVGLSYRVTVLCAPEAVLRAGGTDDEAHEDVAPAMPGGGAGASDEG